MRTSIRSGYIFLVTVLFIGAISISILGTYMMLSIASLQNGLAFQTSAEALGLAQACAERGLRSLQQDSNYDGNEEFVYPNGICEVLPPGGYGNENRTLCVEGVSGSYTRRFEIIIAQLLPSVSIYSWTEVPIFTSCSS